MYKTRTKKYIMAVLVAAILAGDLSLFQFLTVEGNSMEPSLYAGEVIVVFRWAYGAQLPLSNRYLINWGGVRRGDVVVFWNPDIQSEVVKRCIGLPGDTITTYGQLLRIADVALTLHDEGADRFPAVSSVPDRSVFVAGDDREASVDSRDYGPVNVSRLYGKVVAVLRKARQRGTTR